MIEELQTASKLLRVALERYIATWVDVANRYDPGHAPEAASRVISGLMSSELESIVSCEIKLKQARVIINRIWNAVPAIAPINRLPPDVLSLIFQLVLKTQPCYFEDKFRLTPFSLKYPDTLSQVCSRWRQIAIQLRMLWSRVDVIPFQGNMLSGRLLARAEAFVTRADPLPLDIHIIGRTSHHSKSPDIDIYLNAFCASVATRTRSLNLSECRYFTNVHLSCLQNFLAACTPGTLNKLVIAANLFKLDIDLIEASDARTDPKSLLLQVSHEHLEECLLPVSVLRLAGVRFQWASQVYHGLVELRLVYHFERPRITESQLRGILAHSPRLRVLHFGLEIVDLLPHNAARVAVILDDLEVLDLSPMYGEQHDILPQILSPGFKTPQLSVCSSATRLSLMFGGEFKRIATRTNNLGITIEPIGADDFDYTHSLFEVFGLLSIPNLRVLSLARFRPDSFSRPTQSRGHELHPFSFSQLDALRLTFCRLDLDDLRRVAAVVQIQTLTIDDCEIFSEEEGCDVSAEAFKDEIAEIVPVVTFLPTPGGPLVNWDPWA